MPATTGLADAVFMTKVRRILQDFPVVQPDKFQSDAVTGAITAGSKSFKLTRPPIWLGGSLPLVTAPPAGITFPVTFDLPPIIGAAAPVIADGGAGFSLPNGSYKIFWTLASAAGVPASLPSQLSNTVAIAVNHQLTITGLPNPIPAGGINVYIAPSFGTYAAAAGSPGFALYIPGGAVGPYNIIFPGNDVVPAFINSDTGELLFGSPPATGTVAITYQRSAYSDQEVTDALYEGLNMLWPEIWNPESNTTQIAISPTQFEYTLQALFKDQRAIILDVEYLPPSGFVRAYRTSLWRQLEDINNPTLVFTTLPPISSIIRITYTQAFPNLGAIPSQVQHLPIYYAVARLLADQETRRSRADDLQALTQENGAGPPGTSLAAAAYWLQRFMEQLTKFAMDEPARRSVADRSVEALGLSDFWVHAAS